MAESLHRVVIVGGGFAGLYAARALTHPAARVTLVDRRNFHLFQPLLYQVATGGLSPANIATPLRGLLGRRKQGQVLLAEVVDFDIPGRQVILADGRLDYDTLMVAAGSRFNYFGHDEWEPLAPGLKTLEDATEIRSRVLTAFEMAERTTDAQARRRWLTFVIAGGGATGVELAGALAEISRYTLRHDFHSIDPSEATLLLVEGHERLLGAFPSDLAQRTAETLRKLGVTIRTGAMVSHIDSSGVTIKQGDKTETIPAATVLWTAGVRAAKLSERLAQATGAATDRAGRIIVGPDLTVAGHPNVFVLGDMAHFAPPGGEPLPGLAPVAMQQGRYAASVVVSRLKGTSPPPPFHYHDRGNMAVIGRSAAIADVHGWHLSGFIAWLAWLFIHLLYLAQFQNRVLVMLQWAWNYATRNRSARLITSLGPRRTQSPPSGMPSTEESSEPSTTSAE